MKKCFSGCCKNPSLGLFLIRLALAVVFIAHGWQKFGDMESTVGFFASLGLAAFFAYLVAAVELLGGIALLLGIWTRFFGVALTINMIFAIYLVKAKLGFFGGFEFDLTLLLAALGISMTGPGRYALKHCCGNYCKDGMCKGHSHCEEKTGEMPKTN